MLVGSLHNYFRFSPCHTNLHKASQTGPKMEVNGCNIAVVVGLIAIRQGEKGKRGAEPS